MSAEEPGGERHINIHLSPEVMAGHYANFAQVNHSPYEDGWMIRLTDVDESGASLMDEAAYLAQAEA